MSSTVSTTFVLTEQDYLNTVLRQQFRRRVIIYLAILAFILSMNLTKERAVSWWFIGTIVVLALLYMGIAFVWIRSRLRKAFRSNALLKREQRFSFTEEGLSIQSDSFSGTYGWNDLHKVRETNEALLLYQSTITMYLIPKRVFILPTDLAAVRGFIRNSLGKKAKLRD